MINIKDLGKIAVLVDFDGTITRQDTNDLLIERYGNEKTRNLEKKYENRELNSLDFFKKIFFEINMTEKEYLDFILNNFEITEGFIKFYNSLRSNNIPISIISGGIENGILPFLRNHGINEIEVYANRIVFSENQMSVEFYDGDNPHIDCSKSDPCGNCKARHYRRYKEMYDTVVFIGDGTTDRCVAEIADIVFAKDSLLEYCKVNNIEHIPWTDFNDISNLILVR